MIDEYAPTKWSRKIKRQSRHINAHGDGGYLDNADACATDARADDNERVASDHPNRNRDHAGDVRHGCVCFLR